MIKYILNFGLLFPAYIGSTQVSLELGAGWYTYTMSDMKEFQNEALEDLSFDARISEEFPSFIGFEAQVNVVDWDVSSFTNMSSCIVKLGPTFNYTSTGGRVSYSDYSGSYSFDQTMNRIGLGVNGRILFQSNNKLHFGLETNLIYSFSNLKYASLLETGDLVESDEVKFNSGSIQIRFGGVCEYKISSLLFVLGKIGYEIDVYSSKLVLSDNSDLYLLNKDGSESKLDWSGLRLSLGIGVYISK